MHWIGVYVLISETDILNRHILIQFRFFLHIAQLHLKFMAISVEIIIEQG